MDYIAKYAADLASAAAKVLTAEINIEEVKSAKTAKTTMRDQLLEAAYNLATGNVPIKVDGGWLIRSRSTQVGTSLTAKITDTYTGKVPAMGDVTIEFHNFTGKVYMVSNTVDQCTCKGGEQPGHTCWHMTACEFYTQAINMLQLDTMTDNDLPF